MKLFILIFTITNLIISCADILYVEENDIIELLPNSPETMVGFWFACEFGSLDIDCMILDDDGVQFTNDGKVYYVQEYTQISEDECSPSPCFDYSIDTITVERQLVGSYTYSNLSLLLNNSENDSCNELITWNDDISFFIENNCLYTQEPYMKKYTGEVVIH